MKPYLIVNTGDRDHAKGGLIPKIEAVLKKHLDEFEIHRSKSIEHCGELVRDAEERDFDLVIACGGDGTLNSVLNFVKNTSLGIGVLPMGTVNCFARSIGLSLDPVKACEQLMQGGIAPISAGRINEYWYLCFAGVGVDAICVHTASEKLKHKIKIGAFMISGIVELVTLRGLSEFKLRGDCQFDGAHTLVSTLVRNYGGFDIFPHLRPDTDALETIVFLRKSRLDLLRAFWFGKKYATGKKPVPKTIHYDRHKKIIIESEKPITIHVDGEPVKLSDPHRAEIEIQNQSLRCLVPKEFLNNKQ